MAIYMRKIASFGITEQNVFKHCMMDLSEVMPLSQSTMNPY